MVIMGLFFRFLIGLVEVLLQECFLVFKARLIVDHSMRFRI